LTIKETAIKAAIDADKTAILIRFDDSSGLLDNKIVHTNQDAIITAIKDA